MKTYFIGIALLIVASTAKAQTDIALKGDTLILPSGAKFWLNEEVTLGNGTAPDKSFNFIYEPGLYGMLKRKPLSATYTTKRPSFENSKKTPITNIAMPTISSSWISAINTNIGATSA